MAGERYNSLSSYYKKLFGRRTVRLSIDAGFSCPNRDGALSCDGCIFCSEQGSGDFAGSRLLSVTEQINSQIELLNNKWPNAGYLAYFQAFTNTYAPIDRLKAVYCEALNNDMINGIIIATRPDCITDECIALLKEMSSKKYVSVELGLQTSNENTAKLINRGYNNAVFENAVNRLKNAVNDITVHIIIGLPGENSADAVNSVKYISFFPAVTGVKLHLLHVLKGTKLEEMYSAKAFDTLTLDEYTDTVTECIANLRSDIIVCRLTGDGPADLLVSPLWSRNKMNVINTINHKLKLKDLYQGQLFKN